MIDICNFSTDLTATSGYLATPGYPTIWQPTTGTCSITISLSRDWRIRFYIQDQGQEATDQPQGCIFLVTFRALLNKRRTGLFPETSVCLDNGYTRNQLIYESTTNIVQLQYRVLLPIIKTGDKFGFLFYYEGKARYLLRHFYFEACNNVIKWPFVSYMHRLLQLWYFRRKNS